MKSVRGVYSERPVVERIYQKGKFWVYSLEWNLLVENCYSLLDIWRNEWRTKWTNDVMLNLSTTDEGNYSTSKRWSATRSNDIRFILIVKAVITTATRLYNSAVAVTRSTVVRGCTVSFYHTCEHRFSLSRSECRSRCHRITRRQRKSGVSVVWVVPYNNRSPDAHVANEFIKLHPTASGKTGLSLEGAVARAMTDIRNICFMGNATKKSKMNWYDSQ